MSVTDTFRPHASSRSGAVFLDEDMIDWFLGDPLAAAQFLRRHRVQVLDEPPCSGPARLMILTRDSVPGLGFAC